jgi:hypothetical protein
MVKFAFGKELKDYNLHSWVILEVLMSNAFVTEDRHLEWLFMGSEDENVIQIR